MNDDTLRVAIVGCGRMGQIYAEAYTTYPDTQIVGIVDSNPERRAAVGKRFEARVFGSVEDLLKNGTPDVVSIVTPVREIKEAVIACAEAGVKGISTEKPIAGILSDADEMVEVCEERGVIFAGGNLQCAMHEVQEAASRIHAGDFGEIIGVGLHGFGHEISGGGCQAISVLRLFTHADVEEVVAWGTPEEMLSGETDDGLDFYGKYRMTNGLECPFFGIEMPMRGVDIWTDDTLIRWDWASPKIFRGFDAKGRRVQIDPAYAHYEWNEYGYLTGCLRSFIAAVRGEGELWISGHDLRQALEVAIATKQSAELGCVPVRLPLQDRTLKLLPKPYRWVGGDLTGRPQSVEEAAGKRKGN